MLGANILGVCFLVLFVPLFAFGMLLGRKVPPQSKKMYRVRPFATSLKHGHMVNKLSCLLTPRTPAPYKVYVGEVGFYVNDRMYGAYHVCLVLIS
jgi:xanthosine utilization system XapX-like protein